MSSQYDSQRHHRRSIRLRGYDYTQAGVYFVTIVTHGRECLFGDVVEGEMRHNASGEIAQTCWEDLVNHYAHVELDAFVVMPNHVHGIILLNDTRVGVDVGAGLKPAPTMATNPSPKRHGLSEIVRAFKTFSARRINMMRDMPGYAVWQRNFYERIVRSEHELEQIRAYIENNPTSWLSDSENPDMGRRGL